MVYCYCQKKSQAVVVAAVAADAATAAADAYFLFDFWFCSVEQPDTKVLPLSRPHYTLKQSLQ